MNQSLVAFDTDQIKDFVFATSRLKEIRGASALLDRLNRGKMPQLVGETPIYASGGGGLFVVDTGQAEAVIQSVQQTYRQETHTASITGATVELPGDQQGDVQRQLDLVRHRLKAAKGAPLSSVQTLLTHPLLHFCDSCGVQYASASQDGEMICQTCATKREEDDKVKEEIARWTSGRQKPDPNRVWGRLLNELNAHAYPTAGYGRPDDFEKLGGLSSPKGYMGLIYADGDDMGREIEHITTLEEMERFSEAVDGALYRTVGEAIAQHLQPGPDKTWPFDVLLLGGDDLVMVTRAQSAVECALHIVERFPKLTVERWGKSPLTLSASVVLAHAHYPIGSLLKLAESGLKFAKQKAALRKRHGESLGSGLINFLVISSASHLDFAQYYRQTLSQEDGHTTFYRTQRPYTADEMHDLLAKIEQVSDVPRTKLEQLRAAVFKSQQQGTIEAMMATLRSRASVRQKLLELVGDTPELQLHLPWVQKDENWFTPVLDVIELLDFVGR